MSIPQSFYGEWQPKVGDDVLITSGDFSGDICSITRIYEDDQCVLRTEKTDIHIRKCLPINVDIPWKAGEDSVCPIPNDTDVIIMFRNEYKLRTTDVRFWWVTGFSDDRTITSFRILQPEQEENMSYTEEQSERGTLVAENVELREEIERLETDMENHKAMYRSLDKTASHSAKRNLELEKEIEALKAEFVKHKPDPFAPPFEKGQTIYITCEGGCVWTDAWNEACVQHRDAYSQGRVFATLEKAEEFVRVEETRFKLETLMPDDINHVNWLYEIQYACIQGKGKEEALEAINLIGEEAIRKFLEWKR